MTNQASEDKLRGKITAIFADSIGDVVDDTDDVLAIIRTEKLKLLAEVRERVVGEVVTETWYNKYLIEPGNEYERKFLIEEAPVRYQNKLKKEQLTKLTKLEAEL